MTAPPRTLVPALLVALACLLAAPARAGAQPHVLPLEAQLRTPPASTIPSRMLRPDAPRRPYFVVPAIDVPLTAALGAIWLFPEMMMRELVTVGRCPCDPAMLNPFDRPVAGLRLPFPGQLADGLLVTSLLLPYAIDLVDLGVSRAPFLEWVEDTLVYGESLVVSGALNQIVKLIAQRPRPNAYGGDPDDPALRDPFTYQSFPSLAAQMAFVGVTAGWMTLSLRHPTSPWRWVYLGAGVALAGVLSVSRVLAGRHFPTDVFVGSVLGVASGIVVPYVHARPGGPRVHLGGQLVPEGGAVLTATVVNR